MGLFNTKDHHHARCKAFFSGYTGQTTTWTVFAEVCALLTHSKQKVFFASAAKAQALGHLRIESPLADAVMALWALMDRMDRHRDLPMDLCDVSLVYLAISLKIHCTATTDLQNFTVYRLPGNKRFVYVLEPAA